MRVSEPEFRSLFLASTPWIDVRAPIEYGAGTLPGSVNLPIIVDEERHAIGIEYREKGEAAAVALGHRLVHGKIREERIDAWAEAVAKSPGSVLYCFRGGMRSQLSQAWLAERGIHRPIVEGGYKALRRFLLGTIEEASRNLKFEVVCGPTGSGKTEFLRAQGRPFIDLEALAKHRGSAFGARENPQPNQIEFENTLAVELLRLSDEKDPILIEDESRMIGSCCLPGMLFDRIQSGPFRVLEVPLETRVENIYRDYILDSPLGTRGDASHFTFLRRAMQAISRKLGDERIRELLGDLNLAENEFLTNGKLSANRIWIRKLLEWYYDPVYFRWAKK